MIGKQILRVLFFCMIFSSQLIGCKEEVNQIVHDDFFSRNKLNCDSSKTTLLREVLNPTTGRIWMDRNLGAHRAAKSIHDSLAYGDLYQWGRRPDGHQCRNSSTVSTISSTSWPPHSSFIFSLEDWRNPSTNELWQGDTGINNPCPSGFRIPTGSELFTEALTWSSSNLDGAFASYLKIPAPGWRILNGTITKVEEMAVIWSNSPTLGNGSYAKVLTIRFNQFSVVDFPKASGVTVRCIKN